MRKLPFDKAWIEETAKKWPTPFHVYDAKAIRENARRLKKAFAWNKGFREYFAVKAAPNPHLMKMLKEFDFGSDCSSMAELILAEKVGNVGEAIMFTSNDTPAEEFKKAWELGAIINLDDITHWPFLQNIVGAADWSDRVMCCRYNPGPLKGGNAIIGKPEEAKYGFTREQLFECYRQMKDAGVKRFGLHTMVASNELDPDYIIDTAKMLLDLVADLSQQLGIECPLSLIKICSREQTNLIIVLHQTQGLKVWTKRFRRKILGKEITQRTLKLSRIEKPQ